MRIKDYENEREYNQTWRVTVMSVNIHSSKCYVLLVVYSRLNTYLLVTELFQFAINAAINKYLI